MSTSKKLKLFISYAHRDNIANQSPAENFKRHIAPLEQNGFIEPWYDRNTLAGDDFQARIDKSLRDADIVCLLVSASFLNSENCQREKKIALELRKERCVSVVPIILSPCGWKEDKAIASLLVLPTDAKPVSTFKDEASAWQDVYTGLKRIIEKEQVIRGISLSGDHEKFLQDVEMLTKAHSQKERVTLDDIIIYPELEKYDRLRNFEGTISSKDLLTKILDYPRVAIAGDSRSSKTTLCKLVFRELRRRHFVPVYVSGEESSYAGKIENRIRNSFQNQYMKAVDIEKIADERVVPILDDFHLARNKDRLIDSLSRFARCVLVIDDIFSLNIKNDNLIASYSHFRIKELKASLRYELIKNWFGVTRNRTGHFNSENALYQDIDKTTELMDSLLGRTIGRGIMPAYPFFILSTIVTYETLAVPLNEEITSQGYCYQALIYFYLKRKGVRPEDVGIYINFLTEIAFRLYTGKRRELTPMEFDKFMGDYRERYNLPIQTGVLLARLEEIFGTVSFNNYSFRYPYLYFFFVAKWLAEHLDDAEDGEVAKVVEKIIGNLHVDENAYVTIFMAHHSRHRQILDEVVLNAMVLFDGYMPATLTREEIRFFDERSEFIIKAALPPAHVTAERAREEDLKVRDEIEESSESGEKEDEGVGESVWTELRRAVKTVEVMGSIIKNRAGSLEKCRLEQICNSAMDVHLRVLSSFFELIKDKNEERALVSFIGERLDKIIENKRRKPSKAEMEKASRILFWNLNFFVVFGIIKKIVHALGSDNLAAVISKVCEEVGTPASFLVEKGVEMWYEKNLDVDGISDRLGAREFSEIGRKVMRLFVVNYCSLHSISYKERQKVESKLGISGRGLLKHHKS